MKTKIGDQLGATGLEIAVVLIAVVVVVVVSAFAFAIISTGAFSEPKPESVAIMDEVLGTWDGTTDTFTTAKKPAFGSLRLLFDGKPVETTTTAYTIDYQTGIVTLLTPPPDGTEISVDYVHYIDN